MLGWQIIPFWCWIPLIGLSPEHKETDVCYLFEINPLSVESLLKFFREEPFWLIQVQLYDKWKFVLNRLAMYFGSKMTYFARAKGPKMTYFLNRLAMYFGSKNEICCAEKKVSKRNRLSTCWYVFLSKIMHGQFCLRNRDFWNKRQAAENFERCD